jgi:hypothetical protein
MHLPLQGAYLCANCNQVGDSGKTCPACGDGNALLSLSAVLNRKRNENESRA